MTFGGNSRAVKLGLRKLVGAFRYRLARAAAAAAGNHFNGKRVDPLRWELIAPTLQLQVSRIYTQSWNYISESNSSWSNKNLLYHWEYSPRYFIRSFTNHGSALVVVPDCGEESFIVVEIRPIDPLSYRLTKLVSSILWNWRTDLQYCSSSPRCNSERFLIRWETSARGLLPNRRNLAYQRNILTDNSSLNRASVNSK